MTKLYSINRLRWLKPYSWIEYDADVFFGHYTITKNETPFEEGEQLWHVKFCFVEYYDDGELGRTATLKEAKALAEKDWLKRITAVLQEVK